MKYRLALTFSIVLFPLHIFAQQAAEKRGREILSRSLAAIGGQAWDTVKTLSLDGYGYKNSLEQSERAEGPFIPVQFFRSVLMDRIHLRAQVNQKEQLYSFKSESTYIFDHDFIVQRNGATLTPTQQGQEIQADIFSSPVIVLKMAKGAPDLAFLKDTILQRAETMVLGFKWGKYPVKLYINSETDLPTAVEVTKPFQNDFLNIWGDVKHINYYSFWMLLGRGLHFPLQQDTYVNGWYKTSFLINDWKINPVISDSLAIPVKASISDERFAKGIKISYEHLLAVPPQQLLPGITLYNGPCNSTVIEEGDALTVIESPSSSAYGEELIRQIELRHPEKKIKALVTTSDAWLHIGGLRAFAAIPDIKIYHPYRNREILSRLLAAKYQTEPDSFAKDNTKKFRLVGVRDSLKLGNGVNQMVLYPYHTETGDRMMMVWFPQHGLLYTSDLYQQKDQNGNYWNPQICLEVYHSIKAHKLPVKRFYAMHSGLMDFIDLEHDFKFQDKN